MLHYMSYFFFRVAVALMHSGSGGRGFCVTFREGIWYLVYDVGLRMEG